LGTNVSTTEVGSVSIALTATTARNSVVTAAIDGNSNLSVTGWNISSSGVITAAGSLPGGRATKVALAATYGDGPNDTSGFLTAVTNGSGDLEVTSWGATSDAIFSFSSATASTAVNLSCIYSFVGETGGNSYDYYVTPIMSGNLDLEVLTWAVNASGSVTLSNTGTAGLATEVSSAITDLSPQFYTAVRNGSGNLSVEMWNWPSTEHDTYNTTTPVSEVAANFGGCNGATCEMVVAARDSAGNLLLQAFQDK